MSILSFGKFANQKHRERASDWSNQELADFFRAHRLLVQNGAGIGLDRGRSDIGEPWMVFYDTSTQEVFLHIARIDDVCVLVCEHLSMKLSAPRIDLLITRFEEALRSTFALRNERASNVIVHPAAKIIMSISAVFLLFKLDSSSTAFANEAVGGQSVDAFSRKSDVTLSARVQGALSRIMDSVDSPAAVAALASVILAADMFSNEAVSTEEFDSSDHLASVEIAQASFNPVRADTAADDAAAAEPVHIELVPEVPLLVTSTAAMLINLTVQGLTTAQNLIHLQPRAELHLALDQLASTNEPAAAPALATAPGNTQTGSVGPVANDGIAPVVAPIALSLQLLGDAAALDWTSISLSDLASGVVVSAGGEIFFGGGPAIEFEPHPSTTYGFSSDTSLEGEDLMIVLRHIISGMGRFELTSGDGGLMVEQIDLQDTDPAMLGIWSNANPEGGFMTIIGQLELMDDVAALIGANQLVA